MWIVANLPVSSHAHNTAVYDTVPTADIYVNSDKAHAKPVLYADGRFYGAKSEVRAVGSKGKLHGDKQGMGPLFS